MAQEEACHIGAEPRAVQWGCPINKQTLMAGLLRFFFLLAVRVESGYDEGCEDESEDLDNPRVYVSNISFSTSWQDLKDFLRQGEQTGGVSQIAYPN